MFLPAACTCCTLPVEVHVLQLLHDLSVQDTPLDSGNTVKHKNVLIAGFLTHKFGQM